MMPTRRLFILLWTWAGIGLAASVLPSVQAAWWTAGAALGAACVYDLIAARRRAPVHIERQAMGSLALGVWSPVRLTLHNPNRAALHVVVFDHYPTHCVAEGLPAALTVPGGGWASMHYQLRPTERGNFHFTPSAVRSTSPLGLWMIQRRLGPVDDVRVYPNFAAVVKYALLAHDQRQAQMGIRRHQRRGDGLEFHQLREYRVGDTLRQIDWKATARTKKLISLDYQEERGQQIVFLVDCGRRMRASDGDITHFDHTLNAVLLLSYVALRQGDAVGLMSFGGDGRWLSPRKGMATVNQVLNTVYDLQPSLRAPDYTQTAQEYVRRQRKRSLVVLISNLRDEDSDDLVPALALLRRHHLVLLASLKETVLEEVLNAPVDGFDSALEHAATHQYLAYRSEAHRKLEHQGILTLDVRPEDLPVCLVNRYLTIKSSGAL